MIYLIKKICTSCNMKIELTDEHFGMELQCPNCNAYISVPDLNKLSEEKDRLAKELEAMKNDTNFTQTNTISMGRPGQTLKVNAASPPDLSAKLKKEQELTAKLRKEEEQLIGKLKGLQTANLSLNDQLKNLKEQKEEFSKSFETVKKLQKEITEKDAEIKSLKGKLEKYSAITQNLKDISTVGIVDIPGAGQVASSKDVLEETVGVEELPDAAETIVASSKDVLEETVGVEKLPDAAETIVASSKDVMAETVEVPKENMDTVSKDKFDETLQITMEAVRVTERSCSSCHKEYPFSAKFCTHCGARNENYTD